MIEFFTNEDGMRCYRIVDAVKQKYMQLPYYDMRMSWQPITPEFEGIKGKEG